VSDSKTHTLSLSLIRTHVRSHGCAHTYTHISAHAHAHTHTHTHIYIYIYVLYISTWAMHALSKCLPSRADVVMLLRLRSVENHKNKPVVPTRKLHQRKLTLNAPFADHLLGVVHSHTAAVGFSLTPKTWALFGSGEAIRGCARLSSFSPLVHLLVTHQGAFLSLSITSYLASLIMYVVAL
jgi:hypothetical protein